MDGVESAEVDGNLHQVVEPEREAGLEKMGQVSKDFCGRVLDSNALSVNSLYFSRVCLHVSSLTWIGAAAT